MKARFFSAVLAAMILATASVGVTALAAETTETLSEATEETTETSADTAEDENSAVEPETETPSASDDIDNMEKFREVMGELAETGVTDVAPDYDGDPYCDTDGNATLIKSEQIIYNTEEMQFIAVTTKDGHVFYVLINYTAGNGEDNVYFLNNVRNTYGHYKLLEETALTHARALCLSASSLSRNL